MTVPEMFHLHPVSQTCFTTLSIFGLMESGNICLSISHPPPPTLPPSNPFISQLDDQ